MKCRGDLQRLVLQASILGFAGGLRSWPPLGMMALTYDLAPADSDWKRWPVLRNRWGRWALIALAAAEPIADKWPRTIPRTQLKPQLSHIDGGLIGRTALDTVAGAALGSEQRGKYSTTVGAMVGGVAALLGNFVAERVRREVVNSTKLPDPTVGAIEDVVCISMLIVVARSRGVRLTRSDA